MQRTDEQAVLFSCGDAELIGIVHLPETPAETGLLVVTGGPQYRVGSHRQFLLLARRLAADGMAVMRFDYRGMGDSGGPSVGFDACEADLRSAIDAFVATVPDLRGVALWGLCDAASAAMMYAHEDARVEGLVLLNPWARTEAGQAQALLKHYYVRRVMSTDFWRDLVRGKLAVGRALRSLASNFRQATSADGLPAIEGGRSFIERMLYGFDAFEGQVLLIMSGDDLTAAEFRGLVDRSTAWRRLLARDTCEYREIAGANHTFASDEWRQQVEEWTSEWIRKLC